MTAIAYKVFYVCGSTLSSFGAPRKDLVSLYHRGEVSTARIGGFLCFDSYHRAITYYLRDREIVGPGALEVWEVRASEPIELPRFRIMHSLASLREYENLWNGKYDSLGSASKMSFGPWHPGTSAYRKVEPIRPILRMEDFVDERPTADPDRVASMTGGLLTQVGFPDGPSRDYLLGNDAELSEIEAVARKHVSAGRGTCLRFARISVRAGLDWLADSFVDAAFSKGGLDKIYDAQHV
jgi:hypothetical protein